jgi:serine/threonine protein kinase
MDQAKLAVKRIDLSEFEVRDTIGTGAFARVKLVYNKREKKFYALKIFSKVDILKYKQLDHIFSEVKILDMIDHPACIRVYGICQDDSLFNILMEYVPGGELFTYLHTVQVLKNENCKFYIAQIVSILEYLHEKEIAYRDLKAENILIDQNGYLKLADFGFAKIIKGRTYTVCGTPEYIAPEVLLQKGHGTAVDWWCLGVLIYELLVGVSPFSDEDPMIVYKNIVAGTISFPSNVSKDAKSLIKHLLTADLSKRYGNMVRGVNDIKDHRWFKDFDWKGLSNQTIQAFYVPRISNDGDISNFYEYSEDTEKPESLKPDDDPFLSW